MKNEITAEYERLSKTGSYFAFCVLHFSIFIKTEFLWLN